MLRCGYLGPATTFSAQFVRERFSDHEKIERAKFPQLLDCVIDRECDFAVVPLENTNNGSVFEFQKLWLDRKERIFITDLYQHKIELHLFAQCPLDEVTEIRAFNPVKMQSAKWLKANLPNAPFAGEFNSTSDAVSSLLTNPYVSAAAIGCLEATEIGVPLVARNIETKPNFTTFCKVEATPLNCTGATRFLLGIESYADTKDDMINEVLGVNKCYHTASWRVETSPPFGIFEVACISAENMNPQTIHRIMGSLADSFFIGCYFGKTLTSFSLSTS